MKLKNLKCEYKKVCIEYGVCCPCFLANTTFEKRIYASLKEEKDESTGGAKVD